MKRLTHSDFMNRFDIDRETGCWVWNSANNGKYGIFHHREYAHRYSYQYHKKEVLGTRVVMHKCDRPLCVNPDHLTAGTQRLNAKDAMEKGRLSSGDSHGFSVKAKTVAAMIEALSLGVPRRIIADLAGVCRQTVDNVANGKMKNSHIAEGNWKGRKR